MAMAVFKNIHSYSRGKDIDVLSDTCKIIYAKKYHWEVGEGILRGKNLLPFSKGYFQRKRLLLGPNSFH